MKFPSSSSGLKVFLCDRCTGAGSPGARLQRKSLVGKAALKLEVSCPSPGIISVAVGAFNIKPAPAKDCAFQPQTEKMLGGGRGEERAKQK